MRSLDVARSIALFTATCNISRCCKHSHEHPLTMRFGTKSAPQRNEHIILTPSVTVTSFNPCVPHGGHMLRPWLLAGRLTDWFFRVWTQLDPPPELCTRSWTTACCTFKRLRGMSSRHPYKLHA